MGEVYEFGEIIGYHDLFITSLFLHKVLAAFILLMAY